MLGLLLGLLLRLLLRRRRHLRWLHGGNPYLDVGAEGDEGPEFVVLGFPPV